MKFPVSSELFKRRTLMDKAPLQISLIYLSDSNTDEQAALRLLQERYAGIELPEYLRDFRQSLVAGNQHLTIIAKNQDGVAGVAQVVLMPSLHGRSIEVKLFAAQHEEAGIEVLLQIVEYLCHKYPSHSIDICVEFLLRRQQTDLRIAQKGQQIERRRFTIASFTETTPTP